MSKTCLNAIGNPDSSRRYDRRERFIEQFESLPSGTFNLPELALRSRVPFRTALAYVQQLHRLGVVEHEFAKGWRKGFQFYMAVWSKIK